ncbi:hypothetical protein Lesp02_80450 [Lentzea sp. NBRC 105346]|uniref:hypothetical protein n=1 Tax=Lentzea sp. NBRC 105346 TaxID=3032205 RepID=UPI0024A4A518|nr:hypothetical protein [Lentzea sp. NBRC 105346]GLZ35858.1 hypothetical protein Lesp02_80450 [Lentzea sp. NBRC 105346]
MTAIPDPTTVESIAELAGNKTESDEASTLALHERELASEGVEEHGVEPSFAPPLPLIKRQVRGRYRSAGTGFQLELRVDVGGNRPMNRVSGDFFQTSGGTTSYFGSFVVSAPTVTTTAHQVKVEGMGTFTWTAGAPFVRVTIPRVPPFVPAAAATVQFVSPPSTPGASYVCPFSSPYFRTVDWELDCVQGTIAFGSYNTGSLPQPAGSPARELTIPKAYEECGIQLKPAGISNIVPVAGAGGNGWNDDELHNAMVSHFSLHKNAPQWKVWTLVATSYEGGGVRGIMFDYKDTFQRQGCAVFHDAIGGTDAITLRAALRTYVHELGHAFNLLHSWQKQLADPPAPLGPNSGFGDRSWMNYPQNYIPVGGGPTGTGAYWNDFAFQFTDNELIHLRHAFYKNVIMGANQFGKGASDLDPELFDEPVLDESGLALDLRTRNQAFLYGEPVVVELKLSTTDLRGKRTHDRLHPKDGYVTVAIRQPSGRTIAYRPFLQRCPEIERLVDLTDDNRAIYDSAYIGFGRDGFYFDQPGIYLVRAQYIASDGSRVVSPVCRLIVRNPVTERDQLAGELLLGEQQGQLLALLGSRSGYLGNGIDALDELINVYGDHPLAVYAKLAKGVAAGHEFKDVKPNREMVVRPPSPDESIPLLTDVVASPGRVDNITLNTATRKLAGSCALTGDTGRTADVLDRMPQTFAERGVTNDKVLETIRNEAAATKEALLGEQQ